MEEAARQASLRGLAAVSLADVAEAVGLSKSGLFKHFDSKEAMELEIVDYVTLLFTEFVWRPAEHLPTARERLSRIFDLWMDWEDKKWAQGGCPIMAFSVELDDQPGPVRDLLQRRLQQWKKTLLRQFQQLREPPLSDVEAQTAYFQMKSFALGHLDARRIMGDADARRSAQAAFEALLDRTERASPP
ncbi:TetR/AcrR family transcriptional regulator; helix-turn-helix transcriptional regulator [Phenylobacterium sp. J426]|uniref:TetR/AcrR family transcriptional regulator n=1 Tax=Phenylobacterium sp. J426 TaxID=2898439 RepID=UPI0021514DB6|nr:TetR/AcrR family transcriptional regulator [Phenylobacterium sp. J426]MCR5872927.1 TetR/AcrR family transcriptional regulator; helix-turn-helix transcriptional regulator [Phenylobacterium sp. J426]